MRVLILLEGNSTRENPSHRLTSHASHSALDLDSRVDGPTGLALSQR